jgi:hypothetical protein
MSAEMDNSLIFSGSHSGYAMAPNVKPSITIAGLVTIRPDGQIEYHEGYTPDIAARIFWDALGVERKARS